jgi:acetate kinase
MTENRSKIMTLNCGSSSVKYSLWDKRAMTRLCSGILERVGTEKSLLKHAGSKGEELSLATECLSHSDAVKIILSFITSETSGGVTDLQEIAAIGHRVVHGGEKFKRSVIIDATAIEAIEDCCALAPLHNPPNLEGIRAAENSMPDVPQIAIFDTAFFSTMPPHVYMYAIPYQFYRDLHVRKYGFHGTSHLYLSKRAAVLLRKGTFDVNLITLHIGNGVSITAVKEGLAYDHSMGFTPLEGAIMGTRCGDIDPAIPLYLMQKKGYAPSEMDSLLNKKSGLLGITENYYDRRDLIAAADRGEERAELAIEMECYRLGKYVGAYAASLGRVDAVVFSAGVGENLPLYRERICTNLEFLGMRIDHLKNAGAVGRKKETDISTTDSRTKVFVIPTNEELVMVEDTKALLEGTYDDHTKMRYSFEREDFIIRE